MNSIAKMNLSVQNFYLLTVGQIVTVLGSSLLRFALSLYVLDITGQASVFAALLAISSIPMLLSPIGGAISDRFNRQRLMVLYDALCCVITLAMFIVMRSGSVTVFSVGLVMVLLGIVGAMETPNVTACVPMLVPESKLESANGIIQSVQSLSGIISPVLGGVLYGMLGINALAAISCIAFGLAAVMEMFIKITFSKRPQAGSMAATIANDLKEGFAYVWNEPLIRKLAGLAALLNLILSPCIIVGAPLVIRKIMGAGDTVYGIGMGLIQFASILGALSVGFFSKRMRLSALWRWIAAAAIVLIPAALSVTQLALNAGFWPAFVLFILCIIVIASIATILSIFVIVRIQSKTPNANMGKVMAIIIAVAQCAAPAGQFLYGAAFEWFSEAAYLPLLLACGLSMLIAFIAKAALRKEG